MIVAFIDEHRMRFGVAPICTVLSEHGVSIAPSTYYARRSRPATAAELAGAPLTTADLRDPRRNASLGARYLRGLLDQWNGDPLAAVASYNAGPGAVRGWTTPDRQAVPELWVEAIPFPETRLYVKKVLGNAWSYQRERRPAC